MKYYRLTISEFVKSVIHAPRLPMDTYKHNISAEEFQKVPEGFVAYYLFTDDLEITDILMEPTLMVSPKLKKVLTLYNNKIESKSVKLFATDESINIAPEYWVLNVPELQCLSDEVVFQPNGTVEKLILNRNDIHSHDVFKVQGTLESFIIVSTAVVESILRRKLYGVGFQEVEVK